MLLPTAKRFNRPRQPDEHPPEVQGGSNKKVKVDREKGLQIMQVEGKWTEDHIECLCICVDEDSTPTGEQIQGYEELPGRYWVVDRNFNGKPVWRQELPVNEESPNDKQLFVFFSPVNGRSGWFAGADIRCQHDDQPIAWAPDVDGSNVPPVSGWHLPCWSKTASEDIKVKPLTTFLEEQISVLQETLADYTSTFGTIADNGSEKGKGKDKGTGNFYEKGKGKAKGSEKGKKKPSGWMERSAPLIQACLVGDSFGALTIAEELAERHDMKACLERMASSSRKWS